MRKATKNLEGDLHALLEKITAERDRKEKDDKAPKHDKHKIDDVEMKKD